MLPWNHRESQPCDSKCSESPLSWVWSQQGRTLWWLCRIPSCSGSTRSNWEEQRLREGFQPQREAGLQVAQIFPHVLSPRSHKAARFQRAQSGNSELLN